MKAYVAIGDTAKRAQFFTEDVKSYVESIADIQWGAGDGVTTEEVVRDIDPDTDIYVTLWGSPRLDKEILEVAPNIKLLVHLAGTVVPFSSDAMWDKGIRAISGNNHFAESVAEGCIAYMMSALRGIPYFCTNMKENKKWKTFEETTGGLLNRTVGIVSLGTISKYLIEMLQPFGCKIKIYSRKPLDEKYTSRGMEQASLEEIFSTCDIISIHTAYNEHTRHMIGADLFKLIRPGALLLNTSRGAIFDEAALIEELKDGRFTAFLDVFEKEPPAEDNLLYTLPNVLMMPHMGGPTTDRYPHIVRDLFTEARDYVEKGKRELKFEITQEASRSMTKG